MENEFKNETQVLTLEEKIEKYKEILDKPTLRNSSEAGNGYIKLLPETKNTPLLEPEEEIEFAKKIENGQEEYKEYFFAANIGFLRHMAQKLSYLSFKFNYIDMEDLINTGAIGLWKAVEKFDYRKNYRFTTYAAHHINGTIQREILYKSQDIYHPSHVQMELHKYSKAIKQLTYKLGREPNNNEIAEKTNWNKNEVFKLNKMLLQLQAPTSLEKLMSKNDEDFTLSDLIEDKNAINPEEEAIKKVSNEEMKEFLLNNLDEKEREIIALRFGFTNDSSMSVDKVAEKLNINKSKVHFIENKALRKLRFLLNDRF